MPLIFLHAPLESKPQSLLENLRKSFVLYSLEENVAIKPLRKKREEKKSVSVREAPIGASSFVRNARLNKLKPCFVKKSNIKTPPTWRQKDEWRSTSWKRKTKTTLALRHMVEKEMKRKPTTTSGVKRFCAVLCGGLVPQSESAPLAAFGRTLHSSAAQHNNYRKEKRSQNG